MPAKRDGIAVLGVLAQVEIAKQIVIMRCKQDEQWGGAEHDDVHQWWAWRRFLSKHVGRLEDRGMRADDYRERLIKIAALAMAAVESFDRGGK